MLIILTKKDLLKPEKLNSEFLELEDFKYPSSFFDKADDIIYLHGSNHVVLKSKNGHLNPFLLQSTLICMAINGLSYKKANDLLSNVKNILEDKSIAEVY